MPRRTKARTAGEKQRFLEEFRRRGIIRHAARAEGIHRVTVYRWRNPDAAFADALQDAVEEVSDALEGEAYRRAVGQVQLPVYYRRKLVGYIPRYSDTLLMFLLRA